MFTLGKVLIRQTWRTACASGKQLLMVQPLASTRTPEVCLLHSRISDNQVNSRFLSSLKSDSVESEEDKSPNELIADDMGRVYKEVMGILRNNLTNEEMHDIATKYYHDLGENNCNVISVLTILLTKGLNYHLYHNGTITDKQIKLTAILDLMQIILILRDDLVDDSKTRRGVPTANTLWHPMKVIFTLNKVFAICLSEAGKLGNGVLVKACQSYIDVIKSQFMIEKMPSDGDVLSNYLRVHDFKGGSFFRHNCIAVARAAGASDSLVDIYSRFGYDMGMCTSILDDIWDLEDDLREGSTRGAVIFTMSECPELKEMMLRQFGREGDVDKALEQLKYSQRKEELKMLSRRHYNYSMEHLNQIAYSPYKKGIETILGWCMLKIDSTAKDTTDLQV